MTSSPERQPPQSIEEMRDFLEKTEVSVCFQGENYRMRDACRRFIFQSITAVHTVTLPPQYAIRSPLRNRMETDDEVDDHAHSDVDFFINNGPIDCRVSVPMDSFMNDEGLEICKVVFVHTERWERSDPTEKPLIMQRLKEEVGCVTKVIMRNARNEETVAHFVNYKPLEESNTFTEC